MFFWLIRNEDDLIKVERLYLKYKASMYYTAYSILHDAHMAEDAIQQSFIRVINNLDKITENDVYRTQGFLTMISKHVAYNIIRDNKKIQLNWLEENDNEFIDENNQPADIFFNDESLRDLTNTINKMKPIYSDIIFLKYSQGLASYEITKLLNISEETVRKRLERAKKQLLNLLNKEGVK